MTDDPILLRDIYYVVGQIKGQVDILVSQGEIQDNRHNALDGRVGKLERFIDPELEPRVRKIEGRMYWASGVSGALGAVGGYIGKMFFHPSV